MFVRQGYRTPARSSHYVLSGATKQKALELLQHVGVLPSDLGVLGRGVSNAKRDLGGIHQLGLSPANTALLDTTNLLSPKAVGAVDSAVRYGQEKAYLPAAQGAVDLADLAFSKLPDGVRGSAKVLGGSPRDVAEKLTGERGGVAGKVMRGLGKFVGKFGLPGR